MSISISPYALIGARLVERGYSAIPIAPQTKKPGHFINGEWRGIFDWQRFCERPPTIYELDHWSGMPDAAIGVVLGYNDLIAIDIDTDDQEIIAAIKAVVGDSPCAKRGAKGETLFFRGKIKSRSYNVNLCDLLGYGRQTIIPPSVHMNTGQPYRWIGQRALEDLYPDELPELPDNAAELIAKALKPFGYRPEVEHSPLNGECRLDTDSPFRALNNAALANLDAWVPKLGLARCKRSRGGYVAVAEWRSSHSGRPLKKRGLNLKIHPDGIKDFHDGPRSYTPLDLVMEACGLRDNFSQAFILLSDWLGRVPDNIVLNEKKLDLVEGCIIDVETGEVLERATGADDDKPEPDATAGETRPVFDPWEKYIVPVFPFDVLPHAVAEFVASQSDVIGCDPSALAMACLATFSGALNHRITLKMMEYGDWQVPPRLWVLLVGDPSTKKSPLINAALAPYRHHQDEIIAAYNAAMCQWQAECGALAKGKDATKTASTSTLYC